MNAQWKGTTNRGRTINSGFLLFAFTLLLMLVGTATHAANFPLTITANNITKTYGTPVALVTAPPHPPGCHSASGLHRHRVSASRRHR